MEKEQSNKTTATALYEHADRCIGERDLLEARALLRRALKLDEKERPGGQEVIDDLTLLAHVHRELYKFDEAEVFIQRALTLAEQRAKDPGVAIFVQLHILSYMPWKPRPQWNVSLEYRMKACRACEPHEEDIDAMFAFHKGAFASVMQGRYAEAESLLRHTLVVHERVLGGRHRHVMFYVNQLAGIYCLQGKFEVAEPLLQRIVTWAREAYSVPTWDRGVYRGLPVLAAISLYQLAQCALGQSNITWAGCLAEQAYQEAKKTVGSDHVVAGMALTTKAHVLLLQEKREEAEEVAKQAQELLMESETVGSVIQFCAEHDLARTYNRMGQHVKALLVIHLMSCRGMQHLEANGHLQMFFLRTAAEIFAARKKYEEAEKLYQGALKLAEELLEPAHDFIVELLRDMIPVHQELRQYGLAEYLARRLLEIYERSSEKDASCVKLLHKQIGLLCKEQGKCGK